MSTEQVPNFCSERESPEDMRAFSKERTESCGDSAPERTWRSHGPQSPAAFSDQPHATFTLRQTESALHFHALALIPIVLSFVSGFTLLGPPQSRAGKTDPMRLAIAEILPVSVDFVRQDPAGVMPLSRSEPLCHFLQISRLIVGVKRTALQPRPSVNDTDVQLRAKLHRLSRFSTHNGPNEGLAHADDLVRYAVGMVMRPTLWPTPSAAV